MYEWRSAGVITAFPGSDSAQHSIAAAICRSNEELHLIHLTIAEAYYSYITFGVSRLCRYGRVHQKVNTKKHFIYHLTGPPFISLRSFIPDVKEQLSPYVHGGTLAATQQIATDQLCQLSVLLVITFRLAIYRNAPSPKQ